MRRKERNIEDQTIIQDILNTSHICRIGLSDTDYPYILPLNYGHEDNVLYFHCAPEGRKIDLIKKNNKVCFEIESDYRLVTDEVSCKWTSEYRSLIGIGEIEIIHSPEEKVKGLDIIMQQHGKTDNQYPTKVLSKLLVLKLSIKELSGKQSGVW
ncbi:pyridoxamine 5'-phosphate oxidase family protein [Ancylomarina sp. DW003]|nr:pyridoxamine 5'-phosphate oxidase family protein [Ancylomarina sp. DW003]MDE5422085.1 pyridoxamine 5'-phosphate oxidase family protein [Ancylomarina sp. DW003]